MEIQDPENRVETGSSAWVATPLRHLPPQMQKQAMTKLWAKMAATYGAIRWREHAPEQLMGEWARTLANRSWLDICRGVGRYKANPGRFPPGDAQFSKACAEFQSGTFAGGAPLPAPDRPMLSREQRRMSAAEALALIRARVGKTKPSEDDMKQAMEELEL